MGNRNFLCFILFFFIFYEAIEASCTFKSAKWKKGMPKVSLTSKVQTRQTKKVLVDWSSLIDNKECVDEYQILTWKVGEQRKSAKKYSISDKNTLTKVIDLEPCQNYNVAVELRKGKSTEIATFSQVPILNEEILKPHLSIGYNKNERTGQFDLTKASLKIKKEFFTFMDCLKQIEVSGLSLTRSSSGTSPASSSTSSSVSGQGHNNNNGWQPFGTGRSLGENGGTVSRKWQHIGDKIYKQDSIHIKPSMDKTSVNQAGQSWGYKPNKGTPAPTSVRGGWRYQDPYKKTDTDTPLVNRTLDDASMFTDKFLRMKDSGPAKRTQVVKSSPVVQSDVEMIISVEPCQQYSFELKFISPTSVVFGVVGNIVLPKLPDILGYIPPPATEVVDVKFLMGGKYDVVAKIGGPVPQACLIDYLEALDSFTNRVENIANDQQSANSLKKSIQNNVQDNVEKTQSESLKIFGCVCSSPRLQVQSSEDLDFAGVYLYQGLDKNMKPFYKQDNEDRSLVTGPTANPGLIRKKRFIGRVDGGGQSSTTTARNWMLPSHTDGNTQHPPWRQYFGITTQSPNTQYSNRHSDPGQSSGSNILDNKGSTLKCPEENVNLNLRRNAEVVNSISSWEQCSRRCSEKASCQYWVWNTKKVGPGAGSCALMEGFGTKVFDSNTVTGRWDCKYKSNTNANPPAPPRSPSIGQVQVPPKSPSSPGNLVVRKKVDHFISWNQNQKQWIVSDKIEGNIMELMSSSKNSLSKCPADSENEKWTLGKKKLGVTVKVICSPGY